MPSTPTEPDDYRIGRVQDTLAHELNELDVTVTLTGGGAFLTRSPRSYAESCRVSRCTTT